MSSSYSRLMLRSALLGLCISVGLGTVPAWAQITQGSIFVSVLDQSGAVVPEAQLTLEDLATNSVRTAPTGSAGTYTFPNLPTGNYKLTISKSGFETQVFDSVSVSATRVTDIKATLKVGGLAQKVEVSERAVPVMETSSNETTSTLDMKQVEDLPLIGRDVSTLARLVPGFAGGTWNGLPYMATGNNIDGVVADTQRMKFAGAGVPLVQARVENMQEMTVQTDQLNMNSGYGMSNMQVNFVTRRGTNAFHGRVYEDFRNSALNANTWLNDATGIARPTFIRNEFGGSLGGAIKKDKLFFFGTYAMAKQPGSGTSTNTVMSPLAQSGVFQFTDTQGVNHSVNLLTQIAGGPGGVAVGSTTPCCGLPTTVNSDVAGIFSSIDAGVSSGAVTPSSDPNINSVAWTYPAALTQYFPTVRLDYNIRDNLRMFLSWNMTQSDTQNYDVPPLPGSTYSKYGGSSQFRYFTQAVGLDWTVAPTVVNSFRLGYLYNRVFYGYDLDPVWRTQPAIYFANGASGAELYNTPVGTYYPLVNASDSLTWQKAGHTISFGFSYYREQDHYYNPPAGFPQVNLGMSPNDPATGVFTDYFTANFPNASTADLTNAESMYTNLVGRISGVVPGNAAGFPLNPKTKTYNTTIGQYNLDELQHGQGLFAQDSWRVKPGLTLNAGLRWDFTGASQDLTVGYHSADNTGIWGPSGIGNIFKPGVLTTDPNGLNPVYITRKSVYNPWYVSPQPQIGIAWNPNKTEGLLGKLLGSGGKTVIRSGFSLRRVTEPYQFFWNSASNEGFAFYQSFTLSPEVPGSTLPPAGGFYAGSYALGQAQPAPYYVSPATYQETIPESDETFYGYWSGVNGLNQNIHQPYVQSWNFGIQRTFGQQGGVLEVRYNGNRSVHQWITLNPNEVNIFENGFLNEFKQAQKNLALNQAGGLGNTFAYNGIAGQGQLPIMTAAAGGNTAAFMSNGAFVTYLNTGQAGAFASVLAGSPTYLCNLIGGATFSPCAGTAGAGYPINFFQANPYNAGKTTGYQTDAGWGNYHALQVDWRQKPWHGAQFDVNYTWSHTLGVQPNDSWTGSFTMFTMRDLRQSYGPPQFDFRNVVHANGTYDLPFGAGKRFANQSGVADKVAGGWTLGSIANWQTGAPYQLLGGFNTFNGPPTDVNGNSYGDGGVVLTGVTLNELQASKVVHVPGYTFADSINPKYLTSLTNGLPNPAYLAPNTTAGTFGFHPWLFGPHQFTQDVAITKTIPIRESLRFIFQTEFINVWNHPVWANPAGGYQSTSQGFEQYTFASIQSTGFGHSTVTQSSPGTPGLGARQIEFRANIEF